MKRNWNDIRQLLIIAEGDAWYIPPTKPDHWTYAFRQAAAAGFIEYENATETLFLKPAGHDFLDVIRDDAVWAKVSDVIAAFGGMPTDLLISLARGFAVRPGSDGVSVVGSFSDLSKSQNAGTVHHNATFNVHVSEPGKTNGIARHLR